MNNKSVQDEERIDTVLRPAILFETDSCARNSINPDVERHQSHSPEQTNALQSISPIPPRIPILYEAIEFEVDTDSFHLEESNTLSVEQVSSNCLEPFLSKDPPSDEATNEVPADERLAAPALVARLACPAGSVTPPTPPASTMQPTVVEEKRKRANGADLANTLVATVCIHIYDDSIYLFKNGWYHRQTENDLNRLIRDVCQLDIQQIGTRRIFDDTKALLLADSKLLAEPYRGSELVCVCNGLYEIATGKLYPHDPRYFFTSCVNVHLPQPITNASLSTPVFDSF